MIIGVGVLVWRHWLPALLAAGFGAATVVAFWISVIHGLFGVKETTSGSSEILAEIAEYSAIAFGLGVVLTLLMRPRSRTGSPLRSAAEHPHPAFMAHTFHRK
jgi:predicted Kef-type K+ transport protein